MYDSSLKYKWDNKNVMDTAVKEAREEGEYKKALDIALTLKKPGFSNEEIINITGLSIEKINNLP